MWLKAIPLTTVGLKLEDEIVRIAVGLRLDTSICEAMIVHVVVELIAEALMV